MPPDSERHHQSFPYLKYPKYRDVGLKLPQQWLKGKREQDGAEGLWRVHDNLYDLTEFVSKHPGGEQWLSSTKGTDITEAFETHHLKGVAETLLPNYFVRTAQTPRNSPFTFKEHDFYKTLKAKIMEELKTLPKDKRKQSDRITDSLLLAFILLSPLCCWMVKRDIFLGGLLVLITSYVLAGLVTCAHNYFHRADNWRMYLFNLSGMCARDWRISHAMSHHLFTNTLMDIELSVLEPFLTFMPYSDKNGVIARVSCFYFPLIYMSAFLVASVTKMLVGVLKLEGESTLWRQYISVFVLTWMYILGGASFLLTVSVWGLLQIMASFLFVFYGMTAGHHSDTNFFDGDIPRSEYVDWGIHQLDTVIERRDYHGSGFKTITRFGAHSLHHLFPTLDHLELNNFLPTLIKHAEKFDAVHRSFELTDALKAKARQLMRTTPNDMRAFGALKG